MTKKQKDFLERFGDWRFDLVDAIGVEVDRACVRHGVSFSDENFVMLLAMRATDTVYARLAREFQDGHAFDVPAPDGPGATVAGRPPVLEKRS